MNEILDLLGMKYNMKVELDIPMCLRRVTVYTKDNAVTLGFELFFKEDVNILLNVIKQGIYLLENEEV